MENRMKKKLIFPKRRTLTDEEVQGLRDRAKAYAKKTGKYLEAEMIVLTWEVCEYVKREGESCTLNNNCKYPNCDKEN